MPQVFIIASLILSMLLSIGCASQPDPASLEPILVDQESALHQAARQGDIKGVRNALKAGQPVNAISPQGTPLLLASLGEHDAVAIELLKAGARVDSVPGDGQPTPLQVYASAGNDRMLRILVETGANLEYRDSEGRTALARALENGHLRAAKVLIKSGADVNAVYNDRSLLMHVVNANSLLMAQVLMDAGVDINYRNAGGESALSVAQQRGLPDLQMLLVQSGAQ